MVWRQIAKNFLAQKGFDYLTTGRFVRYGNSMLRAAHHHHHHAHGAAAGVFAELA